MTLTDEYPQLAKEWSGSNGEKTFNEYTRGSHYRAFWRCTTNEEHPEWQVSIKDRIQHSSGCPYCSGKRVYKGNSFGYLYPEVAKEWSEKNKKGIYDYTPGSGFKGVWKCSRCSKVWSAQIHSRCKLKSGCPYCYHNFYKKGVKHNYPSQRHNRLCRENSVGARFPHLLEEWSDKNENKTLYDYGSSSRKRAWWKCLAGKNHPDWQTSVQCRVEGSKCLYCVGQLVCEENCLATRFPHLIEGWGEQNEDTPYDVTFGSLKYRWWRCTANRDHPEWKTQIGARTRKDNTGCPYCTNRKVCRVNSLGYVKPELAKEWGDNKKTPFDYTPGARTKVWWRCLRFPNHSQWLAKISHRGQGTGCPTCKESTGEKEVARILDELGLEYRREQRFTGRCPRLLSLGYDRVCIDRSFLKFDFCIYLPDTLDTIEGAKGAPKILLIEYHGIQHYEPLEFFGGMSKLKSRRWRDHVKRVYAKVNHIPLLEIRYDDEVESTLREWLKEMKVV